MYRPSQQPQEPIQLARLPLAKFSHTTTSTGHSGPLNWTHIIGNGDIIGVLDNYPVVGLAPARTVLKVFRDYEILVRVRHHGAEQELANILYLTLGRDRPYLSHTRSCESGPTISESDEADFRRYREATLPCYKVPQRHKCTCYQCLPLVECSSILIPDRSVDSRSNSRQIKITTQP